MKRKLAVVMDPIQGIHYAKDSTLAMLLEAQSRGYTLFYLTPQQLFMRQDQPWAMASSLEVFKDPSQWFSLKEEKEILLSEMDLILIRQDPPFNMNYVFATYVLEAAEKQGVCVVNRPQALRDANEKIFITQFPQYIPPTLVSSQYTVLKAFLEEHKDIILKPLDAMGGACIFRVKLKDMNLQVILETMTDHEQRMIMAQQYLPEIEQGDKRILVIDGEPIDFVLARMAKQGETRANLAAGGHGVGQAISDQNRRLAKAVGQELKARGILFAGLDVIGNHLTEINITSPTCIRELDEAFSLNISAQLFTAIEAVLEKRS